MAPPRAQLPQGAASIGYERIPGFDYPIPMVKDADGRLNFNASVCVPNGVGTRVSPKWGQSIGTYGGPDHRSLTTIEGKADLSTLNDNSGNA